MLDSLFISKVRIKILDLYTRNPDAKFHVRGLVRELDEEINAVRRELKNLEEIKFLKSKKQGNKLNYTLNKKHIFVNDLRNLFRKDLPSTQKIYKILGKFEDIKIAILTENYFTQNYNGQKDIDMLIIGDVDLDRLSQKISNLEKDLSTTLKVSALKEEEFNFRKRNRDEFLLNIFKNDKLILIGSDQELFI